MLGVIAAFTIAFLVAIVVTPSYAKLLVTKEYGQFIRHDGPTAHFTKRGTPTMGGVVIILAIVLATFGGFLANRTWPPYSIFALMFLFLGAGLVGFLDDFIKIRKHRSMGLHPGGKVIGQVGVATIFALMLTVRPNAAGYTPGSFTVKVIGDLSVNLAFAGIIVGVILFVLWVNLIVASWSNAVNLTDGLDGLATGASIGAFAAYTIIAFWQYSRSCFALGGAEAGCYVTRDPLGLAIFSAAVVGALLGFLWWNASPARIFMGDTGSLALGAAFAGLSILTHTELLAILIGGLFFAVTMSDVIQIAVFKKTGKRVFLMAPLHHHFELKGWQEVTIVTRFWIVSALLSAAGVGLFYIDWVLSSQ